MPIAYFIPAFFVFLWSTGWVTAKFAVEYAEPLTFLLARYALSGLLMFGICLLVGAQFPKTRTLQMKAMISGMLLHGLYLGMIWWAIGQGVPAAIGGVIAGMQPLLTGLAAYFLVGERLRLIQKIGLAIGFIGIMIAVFPKVFSLTGAASIPLYAIAVNMFGMLFVTYGTIYQKKYLQGQNILSVATLQYVGAIIVTVPFALALETMHISFDIGFFLVLGWSVGAISIGAVLLLLYLIRKGEVSRAASLIYLVPPLAAIEAYFLFGEVITFLMVIGTAITVVGVYLTNKKTNS